MQITLTGHDGTEDRFLDWPDQVTVEVNHDVFFVGNADTGLAWLIYSSRLFTWEEIDVNGDHTGNQYDNIKIGV